MRRGRYLFFFALVAVALRVTCQTGRAPGAALAAEAPPATPRTPPERPEPKPTDAVQKLLDETDRGAGAGLYAKALHMAAVANSNRGQLDAAKALWEAALTLQEKLAPGSLEVASTLSNLGSVASSQGDLAGAKGYHERALAIQEKLAPGSLQVAISLTGLGNVAWSQGDLAEAKGYHERALAIREKLAPVSLDVAASLTGLGLVASSQGDRAGAKRYHERALAIQEKLVPGSLSVAGSLGNLGSVASSQGDLAGAKGYHERALAIREKLAPGSLQVAITMMSLGFLAYNQGDLAGAKGYHERALAITEMLAPGSLQVAGCLGGLGLVAYSQGDLTGARGYYERALAIREKLAPGSLDVASTLNNLGSIAEKESHSPEAEAAFLRAWSLVRRQASSVAGDEARQAFGSSTAWYAANLLRAQIALQHLPAAFTTLEEGRAQALLQLFLERRITPRGNDPSLWESYRAAVTLRDSDEQQASQASVAEARARRQIAAAREEKRSPAELGPLDAALGAATKQLEAAQAAYTTARLKAEGLWDQIKKSDPRAFALPVTPDQAQQALPSDLLFLAFSVAGAKTHLFLLQPGHTGVPGLSVYTVAIKPAELQQQVNALRQELTSRDPDRAATDRASRALFATLFPPGAQKAILAAKRLLISPEGPLWEVPFAALVTNRSDPPEYLGARMPITYAQSLTLFAQSRQERRPMGAARRPTALVVGDPVFDRKPRQMVAGNSSEPISRGERDFVFGDGQPPAPLPGTRVEAEAIARRYGTTPLLGEAATEAAVRRQMEKADVIHLATHGFVQPYRPMSSGVLLTVPLKPSGEGEHADDGFLQAWEIYSELKLQAELVVLSACETGRGQNVTGEGIVGLTRALQFAGARSIVASQWNVPDESTAALMVAFHEKLRQGQAKDEALRQAMAEVRKNPKWGHPHYWAPFFLIGDPDNPNLGTAPGGGRAPERAKEPAKRR